MDWKGTQTAQDAGRDAIESHAEREAGDAVEEVEVGGGDAVRGRMSAAEDVGGRMSATLSSRTTPAGAP